MAKERPQDTRQEQKESGPAQSGSPLTGAQQQAGDAGHNVARRERALATPMMFTSPLSLMRQLLEDLDRLVESTPGARPAQRAAGRDALWSPTIEVSEQSGQLVVRADVPGVNRDQIEVEVDDGQVIISGERKEEHEERRGGFYRTERSYGRFYRAVPLPDGVNPEQAHATFNNGVLEVRIPLPARQQSQRIQVQDGSQSQTSQRRDANAA